MSQLNGTAIQSTVIVFDVVLAVPLSPWRYVIVKPVVDLPDEKNSAPFTPPATVPV
jgi:hypothetical protein